MVEIPDAGQKVSLEVKTHNGTTIIEGILLHPSAKNHVTVKLVNGYNTSYPVDDVISIEITGTLQIDDNTSSQPVQLNEALPRVRILHTGGTTAPVE